MPIVEFSSIPAQEKMVNVHIHYMLNCKIVHVYADLGIVWGGEQRGKVDIPQQRGKSHAWIQRGGGGGGGGGQGGPPPWKITSYMRGSRGGRTGGSAPPPPGKSQVIWGSLGNKQVDPSLKKLDPPPPPPPLTWKKLNPLRNLEN